MQIPTDKEIYEMSKRNPRLAARMLQDKKAAELAKNEQPKNPEMKMPTDREIYEAGKCDPRMGTLMLQRQKKMMAAEERGNGPPKNETPPQAEMKKAVKNTLATNLVIIGSIKIIRGNESFSKWSAEMVDENGEGIKPHLIELYNASKHVAAIGLNNEKDFIESAKMASTGIHICTTELSSASGIKGRKLKARKYLENRKPMMAHYLKVKAAQRALKENQIEKLPPGEEIREMADNNPTVATAMLSRRKRINKRQEESAQPLHKQDSFRSPGDRTEPPKPRRVKSSRSIIFGVLLALGAVGFWLHLSGNPFDELSVIRHPVIAEGYLIDSYEDEAEDERGKMHYADVGIYGFSLPNGQKFKAIQTVPPGQLKTRQKIEYNADKPTANRIRGEGAQSIPEWLWRNALRLILLGGFLFPSICAFCDGFGIKIFE